jgi:tetratricopeptide (TPR) repeat protein
MFPPEAAAMPAAEALAAARALEIQGRFAEALSILEAALDRQRTSDGPSEQRIEIELHCVHALTKLGRWATAKEDCERLLSSPDLTARQKVIAMQSLAVCCYKLGKYPVALMVIAHAESEVDKLEDVGSLRVLLTVLKGNVQFAMKQFEEAVEAFRDGVNRYEALGCTFETCRTRLNLAVGLIELGSRSRAREILGQASRTAEANGYERQQAYALGHLGALAFREGDLDGSEAHCLRSNTIARPREYLTILWRNCYYLWRIGRVRNDAVGVNSAERTMKTYLNRVEGYVSELQDYRLFLSEGKKDE